MSDEAPTKEQRIKKLERLVEDNIAIEKDLIRQQVQPNPYVIIHMRLNLLLDNLLTEEQRIEFEIQSAQNVHEILMHIQQEKAAKSKVIIPTLKRV